MADFITVGSSGAFQLESPANQSLRVTHEGGQTVFYSTSPRVSTITYDGQLTTGGVFQFTGRRFFITQAGTGTQGSSAALRLDSIPLTGEVVARETGLNVTDYGADVTGATDSTSAIQAAANALSSGGTLYFPPGTYTVSSEVLFPDSKFRVVGAGRDVTSIVQSSTSAFVFAYRSPIEGSTSGTTRKGPTFEHLSITARHAIDLNQSGDYTTIFSRQGFLQHCSLRHVRLIGDYPSQTDANRDTATVSSQATLDAFGVGFRAAKAFNTYIGEGVLIESCGVGARLDGCDISVITDSARFIGNARHIYNYGHDTYGGGVKLLNCDILANRRAGAVYVNGTGGTRIRDNYFEGVTAASLYVLTENDIETHLTGNRISDPVDGVATKMLSFAPQYRLRVTDNEWATGPSPAGTVELLSTYWAGVWKLATFRNNGAMPGPGVVSGMVPGAVAATTLLLQDNSEHFNVTGVTTIDNITAQYGQTWQGREVTLFFGSNVTLRHFGGGTGTLRLAGAVDFNATTNDSITLINFGFGTADVWYEKARTVI